MNNMEDGMSSNIAELSNMKDLSNTIQKEIDDGKASEYLNQDGLDALQQMQMKQLHELQRIQELQIKESNSKKTGKKEEDTENDSESESEIEKSHSRKKSKKSSSNSGSNIVALLQDPAVILALYVVLSHPMVLSFLGKYVPNLVAGEDGISLTNLLIS